RDYLRTIKRGDRAYKQVRRALKLSDTHFTGLDIKDPIKELRPSDYQRSAERTRRRDMMRQVRKDANKQSILANLVHRSTLLHGRKSMTFVPGPSELVVLNLWNLARPFIGRRTAHARSVITVLQHAIVLHRIVS